MTLRVPGVLVSVAMAVGLGIGVVPGYAADGAGASVLGPAASRVTAPCTGGSGRISLIVRPTVDGGHYQLQVVARRLPNGSRWRVELMSEGDDGGDIHGIDTSAVDGTLSFTAEVSVLLEPTRFSAAAHGGRGARGANCLVSNTLGAAVSTSRCGPGWERIRLRQRDDGTRVLLFALRSLSRDARWRLELTVRSARGRQTISFDDVTNRRGRLRTRVEFRGGLEDPVFTMVAVSAGRRCWLRVNPGSQAFDSPADVRPPNELLLVSWRR